jgi:purine-nucleoside phosphorylase
MRDRPPPDYSEQLEAAARVVGERIDAQPRIALVLGSGLGAFADTLENAERIPYEDIPHWPASTVEGHAGHLVVGSHGDAVLAVMQGRVHLYEGYAPWQVVFPVRVLSRLGCRSLVVTNAAGAINTAFSAGDLMLINDHINLQGTNACVGPNVDDLGPRFFDMTHAYDPAYQELARRAAARCGLSLREGVYAAVLGPSYETPAEIRMLARIGADAVGMSTAPEVTAANHAGMRAVGISCLSNMAAGVLDEPLDHEEVMQTGERVRDAFVGLVRALVEEITAA